MEQGRGTTATGDGEKAPERRGYFAAVTNEAGDRCLLRALETLDGWEIVLWNPRHGAETAVIAIARPEDAEWQAAAVFDAPKYRMRRVREVVLESGKRSYRSRGRFVPRRGR